MREHVRITDVAPRDGLQNEPGVVPAADKARLIAMLAAARVDEIEATSFVSPKWIPQLADAEDVLSLVRDQWPTDLQQAPPVLSVLVPNEKGLERALRFHSPAFPIKIALFTAASETFSRKNTNATIAETVDRFTPVVDRALEAEIQVRIYVSCAVACPYEGPVAPAQVRHVVDRLLALAPAGASADRTLEIVLGDTIGAGDPDSIGALLDVFDADERATLTLHLHDTFGRAASCVRTALDFGVRSFDGAAGGLGGCPFAGTKEKPAPGNIATETLVETVRAAGFETPVDLEALRTAGAFARHLADRARAAAHEASA